MPPHLQTQHHLPRQPQPHQQQQQQPQHHHQQVEQQLQLQQSCTAGPEPNSLPDIKLQIGSSLTALALVPGPQGSGLKEVVLWVGLNRKVEFYPTWKPKTELALSDKVRRIPKFAAVDLRRPPSVAPTVHCGHTTCGKHGITQTVLALQACFMLCTASQQQVLGDS